MDEKDIENILSLDIAKRIELAQTIWDSISEFPEEIELTEEQKAILDERLQSRQDNPNSGVSWKDLKDSILNQ